MTEPDRIWINDKWEAYLRPTFDGDTSGYVRADLARPTPLAEALAVPEIKALVEALRVIASAKDLEAPSEYNRGWNTSRSRLRDVARAAIRAIGEGRADG